MFTKRIIPCLDVKNGRVVKGVNFVDLKDAGDPVEIAKAYDKAGADEAGVPRHHRLLRCPRGTVHRYGAPGGGKASSSPSPWAAESVPWRISRRCSGRERTRFPINSAAINNPQLIHDAAQKFGSQCVVVAIDAKTTS